jgi:hypothetical protein
VQDPEKSSTRPIGQPTRGKTARNRLRRVDIFLTRYDRKLITRTDGDYQNAWFVDLGYGAEPYTTLESADRLRKHNPNLKMLGVEIVAERVETAKPFADELTQYRLGGFNLPLESGEQVRAIRAFNVLRQYEEAEVEAAHQLLVEQMLPGGLLIEGTSDALGRVWAANILRRRSDLQESDYEGLVFSTNFRWGFEPEMFQPVLPKNFIHRVLPGEAIYEFFSDWKESALEKVGYKEFGLRQWFVESAEALAAKGYRIDTRKKMLDSGFLVWKELIRV